MFSLSELGCKGTWGGGCRVETCQLTFYGLSMRGQLRLLVVLLCGVSSEGGQLRLFMVLEGKCANL